MFEDARAFLEQHWQKQPLLQRGAVHGLDGAALSSDALFGLVGEADVSSRLITAPREDDNWSLRRGPFERRELQELPETGWTLLIQEADRHIETCAGLLERFRFVPNWRIDDVMVSHAVDGGGVGPHIDRYDVFLVQARGRRRWRIENAPREDAQLAADTDYPVLAEFEPDREWILEPGDVLYLPPRIPHEGVALGECVTCSVGFRVPDPRELYSSFLTQLAPDAFDAIRYRDPQLAPTELLGEIPAAARRRLREAGRELFAGPGFDRWVGIVSTRPLRGAGPRPAARGLTVEGLRASLERGAQLRRSSPAHFAWYLEADGTVQLFVGGECYSLDEGQAAQAEMLCGKNTLDGPTLRPLLEAEWTAQIVTDLVLRGYLKCVDR